MKGSVLATAGAGLATVEVEAIVDARAATGRPMVVSRGWRRSAGSLLYCC